MKNKIILNNITFEAQLKYFKCLINYLKLKKIKNNINRY